MTRVRVETSAPIGRVTLARPEKKNALDHEMAVELHHALRAYWEDEGMLDAGADAHLRDAETLGRVFTTIRAMPKPVVAAVRGRALAGGAGLATACDLVLAHDGAQLGYPEVRVGFVPAMVMTMLRRVVGEKRAFDLVATGRILSAREALELGLVSRVLPDADFDARVAGIVEALAKTPADALRLTKRLFYELDGLPFEQGIALGARVNVEARATEDFRTGVRRFTRRGAT
jgi:methylglutaconyl-CoA hydratase